MSTTHTLLLADDSTTIHRLVELTFAEQGIRVVAVSDGEQAVERLTAERPDIVLADIEMPKLDGFGVASFMASQPALKDIPVLLLTGAFDYVDERRVRESGVAGVLVKPFESGFVINRVKELLGLQAKSDRPAAAPAGRYLTYDPANPSPDVGPPRDHSAPAPPRPSPTPARPPMHGAPEFSDDGPAAWDRLRRDTGLGGDTPHVEAPAPAPGGDYFDQLDAAFDTLDAHLAGKHAPAGRAAPTPPRPRMPAAIDPATRPSALGRPGQMPGPPPAAGAPPAQVQPGPQSPPVYEVDSGWFERPKLGEPATTAAAAAAPPPQPTLNAPHQQQQEPPAAMWSGGSHDTAPKPALQARPAVQQTPSASDPQSTARHPAPLPVAPSAAPPQALAPPPAELDAYQPSMAEPTYPARPAALPSVADAFAELFAAEQSDVSQQEPQPQTIEISDEIVERIAARVAERLSEGLLIETVTAVVSDVAERLVKEEIARIRTSIQRH